MSKPKISILITIGPFRKRQFEISMKSIQRQSYDRNLIELQILIDCPEIEDLLSIIKKYKTNFSKIECCIIPGKKKVSHSVTRRNFLASRAEGEYLLFCEPEMLNIGETIDTAIKFTFTNKFKFWYCGPVYATKSIVDKKGNISADQFKGKENVDSLLSLLEQTGFNLSNKRLSDFYYRINEKNYPYLFFCTLLNKKFFLRLGGLNQNLRVRGWEEIEFYKRFSRSGGKIWFDSNFITCHLPHERTLDKITQTGWNLFNSTVFFDSRQKFGCLEEKVEEVKI